MYIFTVISYVSFVHWYVGVGMAKGEFVEVDDNELCFDLELDLNPMAGRVTLHYGYEGYQYPYQTVR